MSLDIFLCIEELNEIIVDYYYEKFTLKVHDKYNPGYVDDAEDFVYKVKSNRDTDCKLVELIGFLVKNVS